MAQLTVRLPEKTAAALAEAARKQHRRRSEIVRMALNAYLGLADHSPEPPATRVRHLLGSLSSGVPDLAEEHRRHILDSVADGR